MSKQVSQDAKNIDDKKIKNTFGPNIFEGKHNQSQRTKINHPIIQSKQARNNLK